MESAAQVALVTGASSGIGWATAEWLAQQGLQVALSARRGERLECLAAALRDVGYQALAIPADLRDAAARVALVEQVRAHWGPVDILINNAGFGWGGSFSEMTWETAVTMIEVNITALVHLTRLVLPEMVARRRGVIVNVASIAGEMPTPNLALYSATKTMVQGFSEALYRDLRPLGVHVAVVNPGPIATEFATVAYGWSADQSQGHGVNATEAARAIWYAITRRRKRVYVPAYYGITRWVNILGEWAVDRGLHKTLRALSRRMSGSADGPPDPLSR